MDIMYECDIHKNNMKNLRFDVAEKVDHTNIYNTFFDIANDIDDIEIEVLINAESTWLKIYTHWLKIYTQMLRSRYNTKNKK
jgi:hypothetical protein